VSNYTTNCEKAGVPAVGLTFPDQVAYFQNVALINGVPNARRLDVPRTGTGAERAATFIDKIGPALTDPLTAKEKESGLYTPPAPPRILFEGTMDDAAVFFNQSTPVENCRKCPIMKYTDGLPVVIPTEAKVKEMLTGTTHKPEEDIYRYSMNSTTKMVQKATSVVTYARGYKATVEKVAIVAVMAGCRPEYLPVVLALATTGGGSTSCPGTSSAALTMFVVSGPIAKEIGMNAGQNALDVGNQANMTIGRTGALMSINFGGCITGVVRTDSGNPIHSVCFAEDVDGLPGTWEGFNEESSYAKTQSVLGKLSGNWSMVQQFAPSSFRGLIADGYGGMARRMGVEGKPGPHNFLEYVIPLIIPTSTGGHTWIMHLNMAKSLYDYGFKKKADVYKWMFDTYWITQGENENYGWYDFQTAAGQNVESTSGKKLIDLPDSYKLHALGTSLTSNVIFVSASFADELCYTISGGRPTASPIDIWK
jgi:hypothetical protein